MKAPVNHILRWRSRRRPRSIRSTLIPWLAGLSIIPALTVSVVTAVSFWRAQTSHDARRVSRALDYAAHEFGGQVEAGISDARHASQLAPALWGDETSGHEGFREALLTSLGSPSAYDAVSLLSPMGEILAGDTTGPAAGLTGRKLSPGARGGRAVRWVEDAGRDAYLAFSADVGEELNGQTATLVLLRRIDRELCLELRQSPDVSVVIWPAIAFPPVKQPGLTLDRNVLDELDDGSGDVKPFRLDAAAYVARTGEITSGGVPTGLRVTVVGADRGHATTLYKATGLNALLVASVLLIAASVGGMLAKRISEPIENLSGTARTLARGDLSRRARATGPREFRALVSSFNHMAEALERQTAQLQDSNRELDRQIERTRQLNEALREAVRTDALTEVGTHAYIQERLEESLQWACAAAMPTSVLMVDVDRFKWVNDTFGHGTGDQVLRHVARAISSAVRGSDLVGRLGGDEFCIILPGAGREEALRCTERIHDALARAPIPTDGQMTVDTTVSIGVATCPRDGAAPAALLAAADRELYQVKRWRDIAQKIGLGEETHERDIDDAQAGALRVAEALAASVDQAESHTLHHSRAVAARALAIACELQMPSAERWALKVACLVHDIGKVGLPSEILAGDRSSMGQEQRGLLDRHSEIGARLLVHLGISDPIPRIVRHHHERFDGTGGPDGLGGFEIPIGSRLIAVAQAYVGLTAPGRPEHADPMGDLEAQSGTAFDPAILSALQKSLTRTEPDAPANARAGIPTRTEPTPAPRPN